MKNKILFCLMCSLTLTLADFGWALTLNERVACNSAIESVRWSNRTWFESQDQAKPAFDQIVSRQALEDQAYRVLQLSHRLRSTWDAKPSEGEFTREIQRMQTFSGKPEVLAQMFEALNHDQQLIEECLVRPIWVEHQMARIYRSQLGSSQGRSIETLGLFEWLALEAAQVSAEDVLVELHQISNESKTQGRDVRALVTVQDTTLRSGFTDPVIAGPAFAVGTWTGQEWIVAGGAVYDGLNNVKYLRAMTAYEPATDSWRILASAPESGSLLVADRAQFFWTGSEVILINRLAEQNNIVAWRYDVTTDTWSEPTSLFDGSSSLLDGERNFVKGVWTGTEFFIWGGQGGGTIRNDGYRYNPRTSTINALPDINAPVARYGHDIVLTENGELIIWGGRTTDDQRLNSGARYTLTTNTWTPTSTVDAPTPVSSALTGWLAQGKRLLVIGGLNDNSQSENAMKLYNPQTDAWGNVTFPAVFNSSMTDGNISAQMGNNDHFIMWTGELFYIYPGGGPVEKFQPLSGSAVDRRTRAVSTWTGTEFIGWGGRKVGCDATAANCNLSDGVRLRQESDNSFTFVLDDVIFADSFR